MKTLEKIGEQLRHVIHGKDSIVDQLLVALCSNGHVLIEDVPGVGKTTLAKTLARCIHGDFHRIQFTPDLLPTDIVGGMIYSPKTGQFTFRAGPVFSNVLLADEINRASPRTQSALLEAMNERQVTIEGSTHNLGIPFIVIATQNPVEHHGTYPLPEAQLDRFAMQLEMGYPDADQEVEIVIQQRERHPLEDVQTVASVDEIIAIQGEVRGIAVEPTVVRYMTEVVRATRLEPRLELGASPRAALVLYRTCQALALLRGREFVIPDDVKELAVPVLAHRLVLETKARYAGVSKKAVVSEILERTPVPE
jgi:MoxR-like ATPase